MMPISSALSSVLNPSRNCRASSEEKSMLDVWNVRRSRSALRAESCSSVTSDSALASSALIYPIVCMNRVRS